MNTNILFQRSTNGRPAGRHAFPLQLRTRCAVAIAAFGFLMAGYVDGAEPDNLAVQANVTTTVSSTDVRVAEPFVLNATVTAAVGSKVSFPSVGTQFGEFDVIDIRDVTDIPSDTTPGQRIWTRRMTLESIVAGEHDLPEMEIQVSNPSDTQTVRSQSISVRVISVLEGRSDPTQIRDIQSVVDVEVPSPTSDRWIVWTLGGLGLLTACAAAFVMVARRKTWLTPVQWATRELDALRRSEAMQRGDSEAVTIELSAVLRDFLELQFELPASDQTTAELLQFVESGKCLDPELGRRYGMLLATADQAKFAGLQLTPQQLNDTLDEAAWVVEKSSQCEFETPTKTTGVPTGGSAEDMALSADSLSGRSGYGAADKSETN